jgi:hypothetical protein
MHCPLLSTLYSLLAPYYHSMLLPSKVSRGWGLLVMGDSPGFISLARRLPQLQDRVVDTADGGKTPSLPASPPRSSPPALPSPLPCLPFPRLPFPVSQLN